MKPRSLPLTLSIMLGLALYACGPQAPIEVEPPIGGAQDPAKQTPAPATEQPPASAGENGAAADDTPPADDSPDEDGTFKPGICSEDDAMALFDCLTTSTKKTTTEQYEECNGSQKVAATCTACTADVIACGQKANCDLDEEGCCDPEFDKCYGTWTDK